MGAPYLPSIEFHSQKPCDTTDLHQAQALKSLLDQFLYPAFLCGVLVLAERVPCLPASIFAEVVVGKLSRIAQKRAELRKRERRLLV